MSLYLKFIAVVFLGLASSYGCAKGGKSDVGSPSACSKQGKAGDFQVFGSQETLDFCNLCSELRTGFEHAWQSFALFKWTNSSQRAVSLAEVGVGWRPLSSGNLTRGVFIFIDELNVKSLWNNAPVSIAFRMIDAGGRSLQSSFSKNFSGTLNVRSAPPSPTPYLLSASGNLNWGAVAEPKEYRESEPLHIKKESIPDLKSKFRLQLVLKNETTGEQLFLQGPSMEQDLEALLNIEQPKFKSLGLFDVLNPAQTGGLWDVSRIGLRYDKCRPVRQKFKKDFQNRWQKN